MKSQSKTGYLQSLDQTPLFYRHYGLTDKKASILLVHGFGEHSGRYTHVIERLLKAKFEVFLIDLRGHGLSKGHRGDVESFAKYEEDVVAGTKLALRHNLSGQKFFVIAHSMGALAALGAISKHKLELSGMVFSSPLFQAKLRVPMIKKLTAYTLAKICPRLEVTSEIRGEQLTSDKKYISTYDQDPLVLKRVSIRAYREITKAYQHLNQLPPTKDLPLLLQLAGKDPLVDSETARAWFGQQQHMSDASIKIYPEFLHEIYNETGREEPIHDVITWLNQHTNH